MTQQASNRTPMAIAHSQIESLGNITSYRLFKAKKELRAAKLTGKPDYLLGNEYSAVQTAVCDIRHTIKAVSHG